MAASCRCTTRSPAATIPNGDFNFDDLVCQPFKEARDAAQQFLARLDFLRGDRVAFVTFDRRASVVDPDGCWSAGEL